MVVHSAEERYEQLGNTSIPKLVSQLAFFSIASQLISSLYNLVDTCFVSTLGTSASGAVGIIFPIMSIIQALGIGFGIGAGSNISRYLGQGNREAAHRAATLSVVSVFVVSTLFSVGMGLFLNPSLRLLGATETILPYARDYTAVLLFGVPFMATSFVMNKLLTSEGNSMFATISISIGTIINLILDPLFILVFHWGTAGAALATILGQFVSFGVLLSFFLRRRSGLILHKNYCHFTWSMYKDIIRCGAPTFFRQGLTAVASTLLNIMAGPFGDFAISATSIVTRISQVAISFLLGFGQGYQPVLGFNYGAEKYDRVWKAYRFSLIVNISLGVVLCLVLSIGAGPLIHLFRPDDLDVIRLGTLGLTLQAFTMPLHGLMYITNMTYQTLGRGIPALFLALCRQGICLIPTLLILPHFLQEWGVCVAQSVADGMAFVFTLPFFFLITREFYQKQRDFPPISAPIAKPGVESMKSCE